MNHEYSPTMSRASIVPSIDDICPSKIDLKAPSSTVHSQGSDEHEKALIDFNRCRSESAEDWSSVGLSMNQPYINLTCCEGQEVIRYQHMLPYCPEFSHCLFSSERSRLLHRRSFPCHRTTTVCPSHICLLNRLYIRTSNFQSSERDVRSKNHIDHHLRWIYCFHPWLCPGAHVASTPHISLPCWSLRRRALHLGRGNLCRSLLECCSSRTSHHGAYDSESSVLISLHDG